MRHILKNSFYIAVGLIAMLAGYLYNPAVELDDTYESSSYNILETSIFSILKNLNNTLHEAENPDISIEKAVLKKVSDPSGNYNYYVYNASIVVKNHGGLIENAVLVLKSEGNEYEILNNVGSFRLDPGQSYTIRDWQLEFDGRYNGGQMQIELELRDADKPEVNLENNRYIFEIFEEPAKIKDLRVEKITEDGGFVLNYDDNNVSFTSNDLEIFFAKQLDYEPGNLIYLETVSDDERIYSYSKIQNSEKYVNSAKAWKKSSIQKTKDPLVKVFDDPFEDKNLYFLYIKHVNPDTGFYKVSDILKFEHTNEMNRAQFAKYFIDGAELKTADSSSIIHYEDVSFGEWYAPAIQAIYSLGLTDMDTFQYKPSELINRGEVLKTVLDYYDVDLIYEHEPVSFKDALKETEYLPYIQALEATGYAKNLGQLFLPQLPANKEFLNFLINAYQESA